MNREEKTSILNTACEKTLGKLKGKKMPYQSCNTYMVAFIGSADTICLRLPMEQFCTISGLDKAERPVEHNTVMKDFVIVPEEIITKENALDMLLQAAIEHTNSLKPKK